MSTHQELREAFVAGAEYAKLLSSVYVTFNVDTEAKVRYPAPKVERPRKKTIDGITYRIRNDALEFRYSDSNPWFPCSAKHSLLIALLDLFDHPTELVEAD